MNIIIIVLYSYIVTLYMLMVWYQCVFYAGNLIIPSLIVIPFNKSMRVEVLEDDYQNVCVTYQQDPCQYPYQKRLN